MAILSSYNTRSDWLLWYRTIDQNGGGPYTYGDSPYFWRDHAIPRADCFLSLGVQQADRILIVGSGMGYLIDELITRGYTNCWGLDSSSYIDSKRGEISGNALFVTGDLTGGSQIRNALRDLTGSRDFDWVISEDVLTCYPDSDLDLLLNSAEAILANQTPLFHCVHMVTPGPFVEEVADFVNSKLPLEWYNVRPTHTWIDIDSGGAVVI